MENTSCGCNCPFVKQGFCSTEKECPNYVESWWVKHGEETPRKLMDCSPKRLLLQQQLMQARLEGVQQALEQSRNQYDELATYLKSVIQMCKEVVLHQKIVNEVTNEKYLQLPIHDANSHKLHTDDNPSSYRGSCF